MISITTLDSDGEVVLFLDVPDQAHVDMNIPVGGSYVMGTAPLNSYRLNDEWVVKPPCPNVFCSWDKVSKTWVDSRSLAAVRSDKWEEIKKARNAAEYAGFWWDGSFFDSDATSQMRIIGASQMASLVTGYSVEWTLSDNTVRTLYGTDMQAVSVALTAHVGTIHEKARAIRSAIDNASSIEDIAVIGWSI